MYDFKIQFTGWYDVKIVGREMLNIDFNLVVKALSDTLDLVGLDDFQHGKRVAFMSLECARFLNWSEQDQINMFHAGLLHDCGVSNTREYRHIISELDWKHSHDHSIRGANLLEPQPYFNHLAPVIRYHHTHWKDLKAIDIDPKLKLMSNLIFLTDRIDSMFVQHTQTRDILIAKDAIRSKVASLSGQYFSADLIEVILEISTNEFFWLTLEERHLNLYFHQIAEKQSYQEISPESFLQMAKLFALIVDAKSPFTARHSLGVGKLAYHLGELDGFNKEHCYLLEISGLLHDLGKLNIPDEILEKTTALNEQETAIMKRHSFESYQILQQIKGLEEVARWAAFHHETISGKGYPYGLNQSHLTREARIIAVADVFQALSQKRPYRDALPPQKSLEIIQDMGNKSILDKEVIALIENNLMSCWEAAMAHESKS